MKKNHNLLFITCSILMLLVPQIITGQIIADHSIVNDFDKIPQQYIDSVKKMWLVIAGESHSAAYRDGLSRLDATHDTFDVNVTTSGTPEAYTDAHLRVSRGTWGDVNNSSGWVYSYGEEDWFTSATAISRTKASISYCNTNNLTISAFGLGWCWDDGIDANDMTVYLNTTREYMNYCKTNNILTNIVFTTGPVDGYSEESAYNNYLRWQKVRDYVDTIPTAIFFDYADILCWDDNGVQTTETWDGHTFPNISPNSMLGSSTGHIGMNGAIRIAKAMWWMLARTTGWDGSTTASDETDILTFTIPTQVSSTVNTTNHTVSVVMPFGTVITSLTPTITLSSGATVNPLSNIARNFSTSVTYTVTAEDMTTQQIWTVTVSTAAASSSTNILTFTIPGQVSSTVNSTNHTVSVVMPNGTDLTGLTPVITLSAGATIDPASGVENNFSSSVIYTVTAQNTTTEQDWTITVTAVASTATDILTFTIPGQVSSTVNSTNHTISVVMPFGTDLTGLSPAITLSPGANVNPESGAIKDFSSPVIYTVTAQDETTQQHWTVGVYNEDASGINTPGAVSIFTVYPNPASEVVNISLDSKEITGAIIRIIDISGKVVLSKTISESINSDVVSIDVSQLTCGSYLITIEANDFNEIKKLQIY